MTIEIPNSLRPVVESLPEDIRDKMDSVFNILMSDPKDKEINILECSIWGNKYLSIEIDGYRVLFRHNPETGEIQLYGIGEIE